MTPFGILIIWWYFYTYGTGNYSCTYRDRYICSPSSNYNYSICIGETYFINTRLRKFFRCAVVTDLNHWAIASFIYTMGLCAYIQKFNLKPIVFMHITKNLDALNIFRMVLFRLNHEVYIQSLRYIDVIADDVIWNCDNVSVFLFLNINSLIKNVCSFWN